MKPSIPLTAKYRPQLFSEVAGQGATKTILSRAAAEQKVAPAYLFSGTRGVGKTTLARIFAKALNCEQGPGPEPCNTCESCRQIAQGIAVDVAEIDGASNRGIDDAKRLKEDIGYAPLEGRYKIFIIDEAHMLTREAFNALLKTLEEPPGRVTFILATTEAHKFPPTIISRCQHFTFKSLTQAELKDHLVNVLNRENIQFEDDAVALLARRAAGSVRDAMSLLGQVLALGGATLTVNDARSVLGLAGQELFMQIVEATAKQDCVMVAEVVANLLEQGVDMGFFLRELAALWRNLFMLRQAGERAFKILDFNETDGEAWLAAAKTLATEHIHACWQLTLEGQRRVLDSLEPGQALELLLLNIAILPSLIPVSGLPDVDFGSSGPGGQGGQAAGPGAGQSDVPSNSNTEHIGGFQQAAAQKKTELSSSAPSSLTSNISANNHTKVSVPSPGPLESDPTAEALLEAKQEVAGLSAEYDPVVKIKNTNKQNGVEDKVNMPKSDLDAQSEDGDWQEAYTDVSGSEYEDVQMAFISGGDELDLNVGLGPLNNASLASKDARTGVAEKGQVAFEAQPTVIVDFEKPASVASVDLNSENLNTDIFDDQNALKAWAEFLQFCASRRQREEILVNDDVLSVNSNKVAESADLSSDENDDDFDFVADSESYTLGLESQVNPALLNKTKGAIRGSTTYIMCPSDISFEHLSLPAQTAAIKQLVESFTGSEVELEVLPPASRAKTRGDLRREALEHPTVILLKEKMGAYLLDCIPENE